ncbi:hypothetical protein GUJ93_ZPchr0069g33262, partial [Zizania palustris]
MSCIFRRNTSPHSGGFFLHPLLLLVDGFAGSNRHPKRELADLSRHRWQESRGCARARGEGGAAGTQSPRRSQQSPESSAGQHGRESYGSSHWAKDGVETASFMGNDTQKLLSDKQEERIRKKVEKAMGTMQLYMENLYDIDVYSEVSEVDPEDKAKLDLDPEFLLPMPHLSSRL